MFISRTELLPEDETIDEHEMAKTEEAVQMTADRDSVGLFKGAFRNRRSLEQILYAGFGQRGPFHDPHDGIDRCPECHWELEGGRCNQCEWSMSDAEAFSDEDSDSETGLHEFDSNPARVGVRRRFNGHFHSMESPTGSFLAALDNDNHPFGDYFSEEDDSVITISSDVDDIDPVDNEFAGTDADTHSEAESDLPVAMGGRPRHLHRDIQAIERELERLRGRGYESDFQSTNYDDSEMGETNIRTTSEMGESDDEETEDDESSEMDGFIEHDTPSHVSHRAPVQNRFNANPGIYLSSDDDHSDDETNTNREPSQAPTMTTNVSTTTADSSSEDSNEDESRRTPVPRTRPSRQTRVILDDSDEDQVDEKPDVDDSNADESDATTIPAQPTATRRSHLQTQRARRGQNATRQRLVSPPQRPSVPYSRGGFDNGSGSHRPHPLQAITSRRGTAQTHVAG